MRADRRPQAAPGAPPVDPRQRRRDAKLATILAEAWELARRDDGLTGISLRDLAERVDLRQPSLYAYFDSKLALYDALFADGYRQLLEAVAKLPAEDDPREALVHFVEFCIQFSSDDVVRHQLLFQRTIPGFEPSAESYGLALEFFAVGQQKLAPVGVTDSDGTDLFTGIVAGFAAQQVANDPGGDRWVRHARRAIEMYLADIDRHSKTKSRKASR